MWKQVVYRRQGGEELKIASSTLYLFVADAFSLSVEESIATSARALFGAGFALRFLRLASSHCGPERIAFVTGAICNVSAATLLGVAINSLLAFAGTLFVIFEQFPLAVRAGPEGVLGFDMELLVGAGSFMVDAGGRVIEVFVAIFAL